MIDCLRTPEERFDVLPGFDYAPRYVENLDGYEGLRVAYIDEGPQDAEHTFLCLHGEPAWSYLYRNMIPDFLAAGGRVIAPDFLGFGRSDKPIDDGVYGFHFHRNMLIALIKRLNLTNVTLVVQDWGGLIGLTLPVAEGMAKRFSRLLVMNTTLAIGEMPSPGFLAWRKYVASHPDLPVGSLFKRGTPSLTPEEVAAYDAPFPDTRYKAGARAFPALVMTDPGMPGIAESVEAMKFWRQAWTGKSFMVIGGNDPVLGTDVMTRLHGVIRNCPPPLVLPDVGHFVQEAGARVSRPALAHFAAGI